jgi:hypothetical protein
MPVEQITGHRQLLWSRSGKGKNAPKSMLLDEQIASSEFQIVLGHEAGVLEAILCMQVAGNGATMSLKVFRSDHDLLPYTQPEWEMSSILKLVPYVAPEVGYMPAHTEWGDGAHYAAGVELPAVVGIIQIAMRGKVITGDHDTFLRPLCCCTGRRYRFAYALL